ncbi:hypothetical protein KBZ04_05815 [Cyanobium sp. N5-Cardenillas]|nr:hypothetical protein [Cyanobium sp. N5-Cardenillas]
MLHRLLLLPLLSPLLVTLLVAALNPRPTLPLRLLTWQTPALPIGLWMAIAAGGGAALSASATALALRQGAGPSLRRTVRRRQESEPWTAPWGESPEARSTPRPPSPGNAPASAAPAGPSRAPGEPAPTVSVPYRVLHRPEGGAPRPFRPEPAAGSRPVAAATVDDDWADGDGEEW